MSIHVLCQIGEKLLYLSSTTTILKRIIYFTSIFTFVQMSWPSGFMVIIQRRTTPWHCINVEVSSTWYARIILPELSNSSINKWIDELGSPSQSINPNSVLNLDTNRLRYPGIQFYLSPVLDSSMEERVNVLYFMPVVARNHTCSVFGWMPEQPDTSVIERSVNR